MVVVARTVKEAPDWEPQCGVGMGSMASAFTPLLLSRDGDVIIVMVFAHEHICACVYTLGTSKEVCEINDALGLKRIFCRGAKTIALFHWHLEFHQPSI